jgi:hypothetical protein
MGDFSGGGSSRSSSSASTNTTTTTTTNIDRRQVIGEGGWGFASDGANLTVNAMDGGAIDAVSAAMKQLSDSASQNASILAAADATNSEGFSALVTLADHLFTGAGNIISKTQDTTMSQISALATAQNDATGKIDQKTIVMIGVGGLAVAAMIWGKK